MNRIIIAMLLLHFSYANAQHTLLSDEFTSPCTISEWSNITEVEGWTNDEGIPAEHLEAHDIGVTDEDHLMMMS